jgi:hypothetical protein
MGLSYSDACEALVTKAQAIAEIRRHGASVEEFFAEAGEKAEYCGEVVLNFLGY